MRQVENVRVNLHQYQVLKATYCKISKVSPRTFQRVFLVGLYSVPLIFERLNFQMRVLRKELGQQEELLFLQVALIEQFKRYEFILFIYLYLLKDKKDKEVYISVGIRVYNKYILF